MQAKKRYALTTITIFLVCIALYKFLHIESTYFGKSKLRTFVPHIDYVSLEDLLGDEDKFGSKLDNSLTKDSLKEIVCSMERCFNFSKCSNGFKVHISSISADDSIAVSPRTSDRYSKILTAIRQSIYFTENSEEACLFILNLDSLDRDVLSLDYVRNFQKKLDEFLTWSLSNGQNHLIFNLYSGTWPDYKETDWGFSPGKAILAKASFSLKRFRAGFDISLPLFHAILPQRWLFNSLQFRFEL